MRHSPCLPDESGSRRVGSSRFPVWMTLLMRFLYSPKAIFTICIFIIPSPTLERKRKNPLTGRGFPSV